jgi:hypothetical protein
MDSARHRTTVSAGGLRMASLERLAAPELDERHDAMGPTAAGALGGVLGGVVIVAAIQVFRSPLLDWGVARWIPQYESQPWARPAAAVAVLVACAIVGAIFARVTRRLRRFVPAALWSLVFFVSAWIGVDAILVARGAPLARILPALPVAGIVAAFAVALALHVPMRVRRRPWLE